MKTRSIHFSVVTIAAVLWASIVTPAQQNTLAASAKITTAADSEIQSPSFLALLRGTKQTGFALMPANSGVTEGLTAIKVTPMSSGSSLPVVGSGTIGRLPKLTGITSNNTLIGNSTIFEDKFGMVGVGTDFPTSRFTVAGMIQSTAGGYKFPDGTIQTTAGISSGQVVSSLNGLTGAVAIAAGPNITITPVGNILTIASTETNPALSAFQARLVLELNQGEFSKIGVVATVPANKRMVIEYVTIDADTIEGFIQACSISTVVNGVSVNHRIVPARLPDDPTPSYATDKQIRVYADGGTNVQFFVGRTSDQSIANATITISGHLVDVP